MKLDMKYAVLWPNTTSIRVLCSYIVYNTWFEASIYKVSTNIYWAMESSVPILTIIMYVIIEQGARK